MSPTCYVSTCDLPSISACVCCNEYLCRDHYIEHDHLLYLKFNDLTGQINKLANQLENFDMNKISKDFLIKLEKWRVDSYKIIDQFYEKKCEEFQHYINEIFNKQEEEILNLRLKIAEMIDVQQTSDKNLKLLTSDIQNLHKQINQIEHISIQVNMDSFKINDHLITINLSNPSEFDLSKVSSPHQIIDRGPLTSDAIASNNQYLLLHQNSNLYLLDKNLSVIEQTKWPYHWIRDMCWSQLLNSFFLITINNIYLVEINPLSIKHIQTIEGKFWQSCTCSNTSLYLSKDTWNSSIDEFDLKPSIKFLKHCQRIEMRDNKQRIDSIEYNHGTLALVINDQTKQDIFIELRSVNTFDCLWLCRLSIDYSERKMQCSLLGYNAWMVADWETSSIFHIKNDGNVKETIKYQFQIRYIHFFGTNKLVVSTNNSIHFHKL